MSLRIIWHGHSNFQLIDGNCNILVDPFFSGNPSAKIKWNQISPPDVVLVTHLHGDHIGDALDICLKYGSKLGSIVELAGHMMKKGLPQGQVLNSIGFNIGGSVHCQGAEIIMTEAFHSSECSVPTGFIIRLPGGRTVYHAGDTGVFANMAVWGELYPIDLALLPIGGVFTMEARQAAKAAALLKAGAVIPMHWGTFPVLAQDCLAFEQELAGQAPGCRCLSMRPGQEITLD